MNWKKFAPAFAVAFVINATGGFVIHGRLLQSDYAQYPNLLRAQEDAQAYFPYMLLSLLFFSLGFVWIYAQGVEQKPWLGQGIRFGLAVWVITSLAWFLTYYAIQPWSGSVVARQIGYELVEKLLLGVCVAALYRK
ncbi:MAG: hypothetical protein ACE5HB_01975 [Terriglobia bacterium]